MQRRGERVCTRALESHRHRILIQEKAVPMGITPTSSTSIKNLLDRLKEKPDEQVGLTALRGRALSRSVHNLHLAIGGGIVAVPIANIQEVTSLGKAQPDVVQLLIRNPQEIQPLLKVRPFNPFGNISGSGSVEAARDGEVVPGDREVSYPGVGVSTCISTDSDTTSGGNGTPDQTDDVQETCHADDLDE
jgi:hypothetical protein